jgi:hypothetical protein
MRATHTLPENYQVAGSFSAKKGGVLWLLNLAGLVLLGFFGWFFVQMLYWVRPSSARAGLSLVASGIGGLLVLLLSFVFSIGAMIVLHEGVHGLFFWLFTRARPSFAFKGAYAYAALPGWYLPRNQYFITSLAPFVLISVAGMGLLAICPPSWFVLVLSVMVLNASGAVGDLWVAIWLLRQPVECLAQDEGDAMTLYLPRPVKAN